MVCFTLKPSSGTMSSYNFHVGFLNFRNIFKLYRFTSRSYYAAESVTWERTKVDSDHSIIANSQTIKKVSRFELVLSEVA